MPPQGQPTPAGDAAGEPAGRYRVLLADDHAAIRRGVAGLISSDSRFELVGEAADGTEAVMLAGELRPDVVLLDMSMPGMDGATATRLIGQLPEPPSVVLFTAWADRLRLAEAVAAGAAGHVLKDDDPQRLITALLAAASRQPARAATPLAVVERGGAEPARTPGQHATRNRPHRRHLPVRLASGLAACALMAGAGTAAAAQGVLPQPIEAAIRAVGLPAPPSDLDQAERSLDRLSTDLVRQDRAGVAADADDLSRRVAALHGGDLARIAAPSAAALDAARRFLAAAPPGESEGEGTRPARPPATGPTDPSGADSRPGTATPPSSGSDASGGQGDKGGTTSGGSSPKDGSDGGLSGPSGGSDGGRDGGSSAGGSSPTSTPVTTATGGDATSGTSGGGTSASGGATATDGGGGSGSTTSGSDGSDGGSGTSGGDGSTSHTVSGGDSGSDSGGGS